MNSRQKGYFIKAVSILSVACIVLTVSTLVYASKAKKYKFVTEIAYERALSELCETLDNITVSLQKGTYCSTGKMLSGIGNDLSRQASCAKISLGQLTDKTMITEEVYKFLSQIGAFTSSLAKNADKLSLTAKERENLASLLSFSQSLSENLSKIREGSFSGDIISEKRTDTLSTPADYPKTFSDSMTDIEQNLADYPTLVYDGPFADNILHKAGGEMLKNFQEITKQEAKEKAAEYMNTAPESLREEADVNSEIELYCFSKGDITVGITKKGGKLCYMVNPTEVGGETISTAEAVTRGKKYLKTLGYTSLKESYYSVFDGVCTVNFAHTQNGIIHYSDLIKVSVALDSGEVLSVDARGYLMNHKDRNIYTEKITSDEARKILPDNLEILAENSAVIPLDTGKEAYCYEFRCKDKSGQEVLIFIDKATGEERDILLLLYADGGVMTR